MKFVIDRFEEDKAICECGDSEHIVIERSLLPPDAVEGSVIYNTENGFEVDKEETDSRRRKMFLRLSKLFKDQ